MKEFANAAKTATRSAANGDLKAYDVAKRFLIVMKRFRILVIEDQTPSALFTKSVLSSGHRFVSRKLQKTSRQNEDVGRKLLRFDETGKFSHAAGAERRATFKKHTP